MSFTNKIVQKLLTGLPESAKIVSMHLFTFWVVVVVLFWLGSIEQFWLVKDSKDDWSKIKFEYSIRTTLNMVGIFSWQALISSSLAKQTNHDWGWLVSLEQNFNVSWIFLVYQKRAFCISSLPSLVYYIGYCRCKFRSCMSVVCCIRSNVT